jgi:hypothetical protein
MVMPQIDYRLDPSLLKFAEDIRIFHVRLRAPPQFVCHLGEVRYARNAIVARLCPCASGRRHGANCATRSQNTGDAYEAEYDDTEPTHDRFPPLQELHNVRLLSSENFLPDPKYIEKNPSYQLWVEELNRCAVVLSSPPRLAEVNDPSPYSKWVFCWPLLIKLDLHTLSFVVPSV